MARRSGLGRGLGALIPNEVVGDRTSSLLEIPIANIRPNHTNPGPTSTRSRWRR